MESIELVDVKDRWRRGRMVPPLRRERRHGTEDGEGAEKQGPGGHQSAQNKAFRSS
jgi:hypothetical protein